MALGPGTSTRPGEGACSSFPRSEERSEPPTNQHGGLLLLSPLPLSWRPASALVHPQSCSLGSPHRRGTDSRWPAGCGRGREEAAVIRMDSGRAFSDRQGHFLEASRLSLEIYTLTSPSGIWISRCPGRWSESNPEYLTIDKLPSNQADRLPWWGRPGERHVSELLTLDEKTLPTRGSRVA